MESVKPNILPAVTVSCYINRDDKWYLFATCRYTNTQNIDINKIIAVLLIDELLKKLLANGSLLGLAPTQVVGGGWFGTLGNIYRDMTGQMLEPITKVEML